MVVLCKRTQTQEGGGGGKGAGSEEAETTRLQVLLKQRQAQHIFLGHDWCSPGGGGSFHFSITDSDG